MIKIGEVSKFNENSKFNYFKWHWFNESNAYSNLEIVKRFVLNNYIVHDCDQCGCNTYYFVVGVDGNFDYYKVDHCYEWDDYGSDEADVRNSFDYYQISKKEIEKKFPKFCAA